MANKDNNLTEVGKIVSTFLENISKSLDGADSTWGKFPQFSSGKKTGEKINDAIDKVADFIFKKK